MTSQNVEASLMEKRTFRRKRGDVPYPVVHSTCMSNFDTWDSMFINSCCRSLSIHQFEKPPAVVLDLGCGTGFWAIEAAKHWLTSTIVGYDIKPMQPRLFDMEPYTNIAHRVRWVHGNLLDGLDLPSAHFDFVRIVNIGLGVPEDEWQFVFEEVARVMKSGGVLEIIEEDPIFPCELPLQHTTRPKPRLLPITVNPSPLSEATFSGTYSSKSSATLTSDPSWSSTLDQRFDLRSSKSALSLVSLSPTLSPRSPVSPSSSTNNFATRESFSSDVDSITDPRDHSKLKEAWEAMLTVKFLSRNLLSILPFYLSSTFVDVRTNPPLKIILPPSSYHLQQIQRRSGDSVSSDWTMSDSVYDNRFCPSTHSTHSSNSLDFDEPQCPFSSTWIPMHLARTVRTVQGCKEAIWEQYQKLYSGLMIAHTNRPDAIVPQKASSREAFETEWASWENDMMDRVGMRGTIFSQFAWSEPPGEHPDWRIWRTTLNKVENASETPSLRSPASSDHHRAVSICRSMRGYVAFKA
ncbi:hypothetical protein BDZ94DRAFT_1302338 [Collybia nuda]|uniref:Methyltransferase domain-containing protein n=1 Tax=Collybia nuda TaxID=64659 RepID=A0A9P6CC53_9AGAR|nr:hypothetical protein BDZ94DRAFT_1302338 [Collybia nuda]